ncbi:MAG: cache domain-containing protein [Desulfuromonadaceae bacterium]
MRGVILVCAALMPLFSTPALFAADKPKVTTTKPDEDREAKKAKELLVQAVEHYTKRKDQALADFSMQGQFIKGDLYVYVLGTNGQFLASGGSSSVLIGRDVSSMRDASGKQFFREMIDTAQSQGAGMVEYKWLNRSDGKIEHKHTYYQKVGDRIIAVGFYIPHASQAQAKALLEQAVDAVTADPDSAFAAFNDLNGKFIQDDLYVFVVDLNDTTFRAHGASPRLLRSNALDLKDPDGKPIIRRMIVIAKSKGNGTLKYRWRNPLTGKIETKHTLLRKVNNYLVGVGYYTR